MTGVAGTRFLAFASNPRPCDWVFIGPKKLAIFSLELFLTNFYGKLFGPFFGTSSTTGLVVAPGGWKGG